MELRSTIIVLVLSVLSATFLGGCGNSVAGTYELDKTAVKTAAEAEIKKKQAENPNDPSAAMAASFMLGMIDSMNFTMTLNDDGSASVVTNAMGQSKTATGTYTVSGSKITLSVAERGQQPNSVTGSVSGDTITLHPPEGEEVPFDMIFKKTKA
jgi:hypothetical protein